MHKAQQRILELSKKKDVFKMSNNALGRAAGLKSPQNAKYHLRQLVKNGYFKSQTLDLESFAKTNKPLENKEDQAKVIELKRVNEMSKKETVIQLAKLVMALAIISELGLILYVLASR